MPALVVAPGVIVPQTPLPGVPLVGPSTITTLALQPGGLQSQCQ